MKAHSKHFLTCHLAGRQYYDADLVWDYLRIGTELVLEREPDNAHDPYAVQVGFRKDGELYHIGYLPRNENKTIAELLEMGWSSLFRCVISALDPEVHPENQVHITISINRNNKE